MFRIDFHMYVFDTLIQCINSINSKHPHTHNRGTLQAAIDDFHFSFTLPHSQQPFWHYFIPFIFCICY